MSTQLPLGIGLPESASFTNYIPGPNQAVFNILQQIIDGKWENCLYIYGDAGTGKSHLLQAACEQMARRGGRPAYLPLALFSQSTPDILEGLDALDLVCIDDIHAIIGQPHWEEALFRLYNQLRTNGIPQIITGNTIPNKLGLHLPDLVSRLNWGGAFALQPLDDISTLQALQEHAKGRGMELSDKVAQYLVHQCPRDMKTLLKWLRQLDYESLSNRRKLTLPFVRNLVQNTVVSLQDNASWHGNK
ncbi:DnaA regulatory inactivator Hda [Beggiatoa alba B18LD]|uniref:DnaA regulatory inactivator Hda n=1 Tax=Beggiatoa alba B18LD TaxID=395493 RepID=I3CIW4_9GAMM|nr:DnaA regulatory inactivator Hda [Beggiatoa alba]EIJ43557.1 DnaA regulatory inactivator Hda [Beggiatoa alba B18LD]